MTVQRGRTRRRESEMGAEMEGGWNAGKSEIMIAPTTET